MELAAQSTQVLGTHVEIKLPARHSSLFPFCFSELKRIESSFSRFLPGSELSRLNRNLGVWQDASDELLYLVNRAEEFRAATGGNFDISLKAVLDSMGYDSSYSFKPKAGNIPRAAALSPAESGKPAFTPHSEKGSTGMPALSLDTKNNRILLNREIEFGGLGKGYALDRVAALLEEKGARHYYINAGGDIYAKREKGEEAWPILLEHPDDPERAIGTVGLDGQAIAGSASNRRKWGNGLHHLINAATGKPAQGVKAIFVTAQSGIEADAYATALFTAGFEEGIALSQSLPVELLIISSQNKMYASKGFGAELFG